ncbi:MAG: hypothetical protein HQ513_10715 [Rhodospirillales bacterium]|nr:hypothetical protein [Rhodospirillales bacterium]
MLSLLGGLHGLAAMIEMASIIALLVFFALKPIGELNRRTVWIIGACWVLFITAEFWALGPFSFVHINDEGEVVIPIYMYLARWHDGGRLAHGIAGDADAYTMLVGSMTGLSPGVLLFKLFPPWVAIGVHKIVLSGVAFWGTYLLTRRGGGADRWTAVAAAAAYTVAHEYMVTATLTMGFLSYGVIPLAVYIFAFRLTRERYFPAVIALSGVISLSITPTHSGLALGLGLVLGWLANRAARPGRFLAAIAILIFAVLLNWHEKLFAFVQVAPLSYRGAVTDLSLSVTHTLSLAIKYFWLAPEAAVLTVVVIGVLWLGDRRLALRALALSVVGLLVGPMLLLLPWQATPFPYLKGFDFNYTSFVYPVLLSLIAGWAVNHGGRTFRFGRSRLAIPAVFLIAMAGGQAVWLKTFHLTQWLGMGGQTIYRNYPNLTQRDWAPERLFRSVTIPYRMDPDTIAAYGLESFDGLINVRFKSKVLFWAKAMPRANRAVDTGYLYVTSHEFMDFLCCRSYDATTVLKLDALRFGNVEFVISALPLNGGGLEQVSGPQAGTVPPRRDEPIMDRIAGFLHLNFVPTNAYVYKIPDPLPRAFVGRGVIIDDTQPNDEAGYDVLIAQGLDRQVVVSSAAAAILGGPLKNLPEGQVLSVKKAFEGYDMRVNMPGGGVLVVNSPWVPFWQAEADGQRLRVVAANAIHSAIAVPPGVTLVKFRYARPMLREKIFGNSSGHSEAPAG